MLLNRGMMMTPKTDLPPRQAAGKRVLLLVAHGSRRQASNDEVQQLRTTLQIKLRDRFEYVGCAFLELAEPSIPDAIQTCIDDGATGISVLPYFLAAGRHVTEDIPAIVQTKKNQYPDIDIRILPYLGAAAGLIDLLAAAAADRASV
jgi:sirohydrochlorin ferrochelatase